MEQKWKVKNLLFDKKLWNSGIFTVILCILGGILCGCAMLLLLIKSPILAADSGDPVTTIPLTYKGVDDKVEVLDRLSFMYTGEDDQMTVVTEMYQEGKNLYVVPKPLIVNVSLDPNYNPKNIVGTGVWGNILGGRGNEVYSDNVTLVGGQGNKVESGNVDATLLGGKGNEIKGGNESPIIMMGGEGNIAVENKGVNVVIGGSGSRVFGTEGVNVIGGSDIFVDGGSNVIVGGSNVSVGDDVDNVFIFSPGDDSFSPNNTGGDNAFYLDVENGLGLNTPGREGGVESRGAVSFGEIDIDTNCGEADLGVEGVWSGCLVGCTRASLDGGGKWEMLDQGTDCIEKCEANPKCTTADDNNTVIPYDSFCTTGAISTENAYMCDTGALADHKNVVFETTLIDSENNCPNGENKCVYKCNESYHLTGDKTGKPNSINPIACYSDCELPWKDENGETIKIKHNETVTGYNSDEALCSVDNFDYGSSNNTQHDHCGNHKKTLICSDGILYQVKSNGQADLSKPATGTDGNGPYTIGTCLLSGFSCNTDEYNLSKDDIVRQGSLYDTGVNWINAKLNSGDGKVFTGTRGKYKLCIDYTPDSNPNGEKCNEEPEPPYHFRLVGCMSGYMTGDHHPGECRKKVDLTFESRTTNCGDVGFRWPKNNDKYLLSPVTEGYFIDLTASDAPVARKRTVAGDWIFLGWNTDKDAHEGLTGFTMDGKNEVLYAIYTKDVAATFSENGTGIEVIPPTTGGCVMWNCSTGCSFTGKYDFNVIGGWNWKKDGWNTDKDAHGSLFSGGDNVKITINRDVNFYTISHMPREVIFYKNGAEKLIPETGSNTAVSTELWCDWYNNRSELGTGCSVTTPKIIRSGWQVLGWDTDPIGTGRKFKVNTGLYTKEETGEYYAKTMKKLTGKFNPNRSAKYNKNAITGIVYPKTEPWIIPGTCYLSNTGTLGESCKITMPEFNTTQWYAPRGWTLYSGDVKLTGDIISFYSGVRLTGDTIFYAQVQLESECPTGDIKVTYNVGNNGGSAVILPDGTKVNGNYSVYALPGDILSLTGYLSHTGYRGYKSGWIFMGWSLSSEVGAKTPLSDKLVQCNEVTLYALFKKECEVFFDPNGGKIYSSGYYIGNEIATGSCTIWNSNSGCKIAVPLVVSGVNTPIPLGFSKSVNDYLYIIVGNNVSYTGAYLDSSKPLKCGGKYYAQTKRDVNLIFNKNGNNGTDKTIRACTYYNTGDSCTTDYIKSQKCIPATGGYEVIGWSTAANRHQNDWGSEATGGKFTLTGDITYYCQSKKNITVTFNKNGNKLSGSNISTCTGYNGSGCEIKAINFEPATGHTKIGWSSATGNHKNEWPIGSGKIFTTSATYYAQSYKVYTLKFNSTTVCAVSGIDEKYWTGYNGLGGGTGFTSPDIVSEAGFVKEGWSTGVNVKTGYWLVKTDKILEFSNSSTGAQYYAQCRPEENGKCGKCVYGCASGTMEKVWVNNNPKLAKWKCIGRDGYQECTNECSDDEILRGNDMDGWGCKKSCNSCAKNGFPYCFPIDFTASCTENLSGSCGASNMEYTSISEPLCGQFPETCSRGTFEDVEDTIRYYKWNCKANGHTRSCEAEKDLLPLLENVELEISCNPTGVCPRTQSGGACVSYDGCNRIVSYCIGGSWSSQPSTSNLNPCGGGGGGGGGCFLAGTPVITSEGSKNIEDIEVGDIVLTYDTLRFKTEFNKVTKKLVHENNEDELYELTIDGDLLKVTRVHPFFVVNEDISDYQCNEPFKIRHAQSLKIGDKLLMSDGRYVTIENITHHRNYSTVYNLEVENLHNYFAGKGYLVHNGVQGLQAKALKEDVDFEGGWGCGITVNAFENENGLLCGWYDSCNGTFSTLGC